MFVFMTIHKEEHALISIILCKGSGNKYRTAYNSRMCRWIPREMNDEDLFLWILNGLYYIIKRGENAGKRK